MEHKVEEEREKPLYRLPEPSRFTVLVIASEKNQEGLKACIHTLGQDIRRAYYDTAFLNVGK